MGELLAFTIVGLVIGSGYAIAASGLVVTYATSNVFNVGHGAIGMLMAFVYWELNTARGVPALVALPLVVLVLAPLFGVVTERLVMRRLTDAPVAVSLVVTVALLVFLIGIVQAFWPPTGRNAEEFFPGRGVAVGDVFLTAHQMIIFALALGCAAGLYVLFNRTRTGVAMRAVVDGRELLRLHGARPDRLSSVSWALGSGLAALAGILLAPQVGLDYIALTLLVVNAYAAAMLGRLKNLPRTFAGALALGLVQSYFLYVLSFLPDSVAASTLVQGVRASLPTLFLFAVMLALPQDRLRVGRLSGTSLPPLPSWPKVGAWSAVFLATVFALTGLLEDANISRLGQALALSVLMLSLVLLTGYGGDVSLGQLTFAGVGALVVGRLFTDVTPLAVLSAGLVAGLLGALVALPTLRLRGLYLGLGTLAFAAAMDKLVFENPTLGFGDLGGSLLVERPVILGLSLQSERAYAMLVAVSFVVIAVLVLAIRRGTIGRFLLAARDSEAACATLGFSTTTVRMAVFAVSSGLAGVAGAVYAGERVSVGSGDFTFFASLPLLLLAVVGGVTSVTGALIGGLALGLLPVLQEEVPALGGGAFALVALAAFTLGGNPNGVAALLFRAGAALRGAASRSTTDMPARPSASAENTEGGVLVGTARG